VDPADVPDQRVADDRLPSQALYRLTEQLYGNIAT
jgi:hypothetical protein